MELYNLTVSDGAIIIFSVIIIIAIIMTIIAKIYVYPRVRANTDDYQEVV